MNHLVSEDMMRRTETVAVLRIHVERAMARVKQFRCLSTGAFSFHRSDLLGEIFYVCAMLSNLGISITVTGLLQ